jgi:hypothetical protein
MYPAMDLSCRAYDCISLRVLIRFLKICVHLRNLRINLFRSGLRNLWLRSPSPDARGVADVFLKCSHDGFVAAQSL